MIGKKRMASVSGALVVLGLVWASPTVGDPVAPVRARSEGETTITLTVSDGAATAMTSFTLSVVERTYYLAEGATGSFFDTDILLANPNSVEAPVVIRFLTGDGVSSWARMGTRGSSPKRSR